MGWLLEEVAEGTMTSLLTRRLAPREGVRFWALALVLSSFGCAGNYHDRYADEHPGWVPVAPSAGIDLEELVATIQAPPVDDVQLLTPRLAIFRTDVEPWSEHSVEDLLSGSFAPTSEGDYAVVAAKSCRSSRQLESYREMQTSWYMLSKNKLIFWDHTEFSRLCIMSSDYFPALVSYVPIERRLVAIAAKYPNLSLWANRTYRKGLRLVAVGRLEDAEAMLAQGDREPDSGGEAGGQVRVDGPGQIKLDQTSNRGKLRAALVDAIEALRSDRSKVATVPAPESP